MPTARAAILLALCVLLPHTAAAEPQIFGWLEWAYLGPTHTRIKAKLDTGAKTSSIHAADIKLFDRDGEQWVRFRVPFNMNASAAGTKRDVFFERPLLRRAKIKEHDRAAAQRYVVNVDLCLGGLTFTTPVTLADRSRFNYPLLLGRLALESRGAVDPAQKYISGDACSEKSS